MDDVEHYSSTTCCPLATDRNDLTGSADETASKKYINGVSFLLNTGFRSPVHKRDIQHICCCKRNVSRNYSKCLSQSKRISSRTLPLIIVKHRKQQHSFIAVFSEKQQAVTITTFHFPRTLTLKTELSDA